MLQTSEYYDSPDYYRSLTIQQRQTYDRQERFFKAYARIGRIYEAADSVDVPPGTIDYWRANDTQGFQKRMQLAHARFVEHLESVGDAWAATTKHNPQIWRIFRLKAEAPEKYREDVKIQGLEPLTQLLEEARKLAARDIQKRQELEQGAAEGSYKELESAPYNKEAE